MDQREPWANGTGHRRCTGHTGTMAILVDEARWPWRGERWAHLVSDQDLDELHDFAAELGLRRLAFQGDHYDIPARMLDQAVHLGAEAVGSRELVRRLVASGLRHRAKLDWSVATDLRDERPEVVRAAADDLIAGGVIPAPIARALNVELDRPDTDPQDLLVLEGVADVGVGLGRTGPAKDPRDRSIRPWVAERDGRYWIDWIAPRDR